MLLHLLHLQHAIAQRQVVAGLPYPQALQSPAAHISCPDVPLPTVAQTAQTAQTFPADTSCVVGHACMIAGCVWVSESSKILKPSDCVSGERVRVWEFAGRRATPPGTARNCAARSRDACGWHARDPSLCRPAQRHARAHSPGSLCSAQRRVFCVNAPCLHGCVRMSLCAHSRALALHTDAQSCPKLQIVPSAVGAPRQAVLSLATRARKSSELPVWALDNDEGGRGGAHGGSPEDRTRGGEQLGGARGAPRNQRGPAAVQAGSSRPAGTGKAWTGPATASPPPLPRGAAAAGLRVRARYETKFSPSLSRDSLHLGRLAGPRRRRRRGD